MFQAILVMLCLDFEIVVPKTGEHLLLPSVPALQDPRDLGDNRHARRRRARSA